MINAYCGEDLISNMIDVMLLSIGFSNSGPMTAAGSVTACVVESAKDE